MPVVGCVCLSLRGAVGAGGSCGALRNPPNRPPHAQASAVTSHVSKTARYGAQHQQQFLWALGPARLSGVGASPPGGMKLASVIGCAVVAHRAWLACAYSKVAGGNQGLDASAARAAIRAV